MSDTRANYYKENREKILAKNKEYYHKKKADPDFYKNLLIRNLRVGKIGEMVELVYCTGLENRRSSRIRGFESRPLLNNNGMWTNW